MSGRRLDSSKLSDGGSGSGSRKRLMSKVTTTHSSPFDHRTSKVHNYNKRSRSSVRSSDRDLDSVSVCSNNDHAKTSRKLGYSNHRNDRRTPEQPNPKKRHKANHNEKTSTTSTKSYSKKKLNKKKSATSSDSKKSNRKSPVIVISSDSEDRRRSRYRRTSRSHYRSRSSTKSTRTSSASSSRSSTTSKSSSTSSSSESSTTSCTSVVRLAIGHATTGLPLTERFSRIAQWNSDRKYLDSNLNITKQLDNDNKHENFNENDNQLPSPPRFSSADNPSVMSLYPEKLLQNGPNGLGGWDDARVRYQHYKGLGYLRDIDIDDFLKWEQWWYKYQEWLENKKYYENLINRTRRVNRNFGDLKRGQHRPQYQRRPLLLDPQQQQQELEQLEIQIQQRFQQEEEKQRQKELLKQQQQRSNDDLAGPEAEKQKPDEANASKNGEKQV